MGLQLNELLQKCTAIVFFRISRGSGFFVAPGLLLTCAHVIGYDQSSPEEIEVFWKRQSDQVPNEKIDADVDWTKKPYKVLKVTVKADVDLALLQVDITDHPCVWLTKEEVLPGEELYNFGYPAYKPESIRGEPATYFLEGKTDDAIGQLKFKGAHVMKGQSGSPLLIKNSGYVCAVVKQRLSPSDPFGGLAISAATVLQAFPEIETRQQLFHREDQRWMDCLWENTGLPKTDLRLQLLQSVRASWIKPVLEEHLRQVAFILLGLSELPEAIENPLRLPRQETDQSERGLPLHTTITQVYDQSIDGSLLILGEPGGGKTTMLLELARNLLERTRRDGLRNPPSELSNRHPIPVVLNLSPWAVKQQPLADWLIEELQEKYNISRTVGKFWIESDQVLPLLDGLDEVRQNALTACVKAINTYRKEHNSLPMVVSSNRDAYLSLTTRLHMRSAVVVQPLTTGQIDECLESAGPQLERLRSACLNDPVMQKLLTRPLMLNMLMTIFRKMPDNEDLLISGPLEGRRQQIFAKYVQQRFEEYQIANARYTSKQAIHWLCYLAKQLHRETLTDFSVESLQPSWLQNSNKSIYHVYNWCIGSVYGLVFGLPLVLMEGGLQPPLLPSVIWLVVFGLVGGVLYPIRSIRIRPAEAITWSWKGLRSGLVTGMVIGLVIGWLYALGIGLASDGLSLAMIPVLGIDRATGIMVSELLRSVQSAGSIVGAVSAIFFGVVFGLFRGLFSKQFTVQANRLPNSGIRHSMKNGLIFGPLLCLVVSMIVTFVLWRLLGYDPNIPIYEQYYDLESVLHTGLIIGLLIGLVFGLSKGLGAFVQHYLLRFWFWRTNCLPWNLVHFLDEVARRHLLDKLGGNYKFFHESLLEYFSTLDEPTSTAPKKASILHGKLKLSLIWQLFTGSHPDPISRIRLAWQITLRVLLAVLIIVTVLTLVLHIQ